MSKVYPEARPRKAFSPCLLEKPPKISIMPVIGLNLGKRLLYALDERQRRMLSSCKGKPSYLKTGGKSVGIKLKSCNFCFCLYIPVSFTQICFTPVSQVLSFLFYFESFPMYACSKMNLAKPKLTLLLNLSY